MYEQLKQLIIFQIPEQDLLYDIAHMVDDPNHEEHKQSCYCAMKHLLDDATRFGWNGNLWQCYLTYLLVTNENSYTLSKERRHEELEGSIQEFLLHDLHIFYDLFHYDFTSIDQHFSTPWFQIITSYHAVTKRKEMYDGFIGEQIMMLAKQLSQASTPLELLHTVDTFYGQYGIGTFAFHKAFRIKEQAHGCSLAEITNLDEITLDTLIGYEEQKQELMRNTEVFVHGEKANNVLLYGESGTGKSTSIKAIANMYYAKGLRLIEVHKHQFHYLHDIIQQVKTRNYFFIIYMDDLSFEEDETEYKYLKAVIEGGLETKPQNVVIYATSNRRHLIKETWRDRSDVVEEQDLHISETMSEKLSLAARFGISIYYGKPSPKEYQSIVKGLAQREELSMYDEQELWQIANAWELRHGGMSGRCAKQLIDYLSAKGTGDPAL